MLHTYGYCEYLLYYTGAQSIKPFQNKRSNLMLMSLHADVIQGQQSWIYWKYFQGRVFGHKSTEGAHQ